MRLSDVDILFYRRTGGLDITPWDDDSLQAASYDLHLAPYVAEQYRDHDSDELRWYRTKFYDDCRDTLTYELAPNGFVLMSTIETVSVPPNLSATVAGKSSRAREGLQIESAGFVDPGFRGQLTLEIKNMLGHPIILTAGMPICQIIFDELRTPTQRPYGVRGHYQGQEGPTESWESK